MWATFDFFPLPTSPKVPTGAFLVWITCTDGAVNLSGERWINHPDGYAMTNLSVWPRADHPDHLMGRVHLQGCSDYAVDRILKPGR